MPRLLLVSLAFLTGSLLVGSWPSRALAAPQSPPQSKAKAAETDGERLERKVRKLLKVNGTESMQKRTMEQMLGQFEKMGLPPEFGEKFMARFDFDHLIDLGVKVHVAHLDEPTVDAMIVFYESPSGLKLVEALPELSAEMARVGMEYGQKIGAEVGAELDK